MVDTKTRLEEVTVMLVEQFGYFDGVREMAERIVCNYMNIDVGS